MGDVGETITWGMFFQWKLFTFGIGLITFKEKNYVFRYCRRGGTGGCDPSG